MDKKEFLDVSREYFKSIGFQTLKNSKFYYDSKDFILMIWMNHSNYSEQYYIDYYIKIKALHLNISNDIEWDTHFCRLTNGKDKALLVKYAEIELLDYIKVLNKRADEQIVPILKHGIKYLKELVINPKKYPQYYMFFTDEAKSQLLKLKV